MTLLFRTWTQQKVITFCLPFQETHTNPYNPLHLQSHYPHSYIEQHHQSPYYHTGLLSTLLLPEKAETVSQTVIAITLIRAFMKHYLSVWVELPLQAVNNYRKLQYSGLRASSLFHVASYEQEVGERHQCHQWMTHVRPACRTLGELYTYQPLRDFTHAQEQARIWPGWLVASTDLRSSRAWSGCQACFWMLLSCTLNTRNLTISRLFAVTLNSLLHDFSVQAGSIFLYF